MIAQAHYHVKTPSSRKCDHDGIDSVITHGYIGLIEARQTETTMTTFEIKYENGATNKTAIAYGTDIYEAIRSLGFKDAETFMWSRVVTYRQIA